MIKKKLRKQIGQIIYLHEKKNLVLHKHCITQMCIVLIPALKYITKVHGNVQLIK